MIWSIILSVFLSGVSLAMDAFAVSICDGMVYKPLIKRKAVFISATFGVFQAVMPIIGFYIGFAFGQIPAFDAVDHWIAFALLTIIGLNMIIGGAKELRKHEEEPKPKSFSYGEVLLQGVATSIDALFVGFGFTVMLGGTFNLHVAAIVSAAAIGIITFGISIVGVVIGIKIGSLFRKKVNVAEIIGGCVLILLAVKMVLDGYGLLGF